MWREIIFSAAGHITVFTGLIVTSFIGVKKHVTETVVPITTVSPQQIERLLKQSVVKEEPKRYIPQVQIKPEEAIPNRVKRRKQTAKTTETQQTNQSEKKKGTQLPGIQTDAEVDLDYLVALRDRILLNWSYPRLNESYSTTIYFRISKDGTIKGIIKVEKPTSNVRFDRSAYDAIHKSNPFAPLPDEFKEDGLGVHINFIYDPA
ncbi:MAG: TonB C-terminal domain-containing protein [Candidatus Latescibacteria bacterium]|nr:TonB C-terminal domain-containing protein [Candidatus Latescibacterota bacterium]